MTKPYIRSKERACKAAGIESRTLALPASTSQQELLERVARLNADPAVHAILVQLPLPRNIDVEAVVRAIDPLKDVDCFHPENLGLLFRDTPRFLPCTPAGVLDVLDAVPEELSGRRAVVVGRSLIVGKPLAVLLLRRNLTVTVCHSRSRDLEQLVGEADLLVAAVGRAAIIPGSWVKPGAIVVDVGTNPTLDGGLEGDVEYAPAAERAAWITPVPGGVGPLTVARLLSNVLLAAELQD